MEYSKIRYEREAEIQAIRLKKEEELYRLTQEAYGVYRTRRLTAKEQRAFVKGQQKKAREIRRAEQQARWEEQYYQYQGRAVMMDEAGTSLPRPSPEESKEKN